MPAEFQKAMNYIPIDLQNTYYFLDGTIIVCTGSESDYINYVIKCLKKLNEDKLPNKFKCVTWLKRKLNGWVINLLLHVFSHSNAKLAVLAIQPPATLKSLTSFPGSVHYISKLIQHLAQLCPPRRLLKKSAKYV